MGLRLASWGMISGSRLIMTLGRVVGGNTNQSDAAVVDGETSNGPDGKKEVPRRQSLDDFIEIRRRGRKLIDDVVNKKFRQPS